MASRIQCDAILDLMKHHATDLGKLSPDMRSRVASLASSGAWHKEHLAQILDRLTPKASNTARVKMQKVAPNIIHYFTRTEWEQFKNKGMHLAMDFLISRLLQLGYRNASEPCMAWCSSLLLYIAEMGGSAQSTKQQVFAHFKNEYHLRGKKAANPGTVPSFLPMPDVFKEDNPDLFGSVFPVEQPTTSLIDLSTVQLPWVAARPSRKDSSALQLLEDQRSSAGVPQLKIFEKIISLQQDNMKLLQNSVGSCTPGPACSLKALVAPPMALALRRSSSGSQESMVSFGEPRLGAHRVVDGAVSDADLGQPRSDAFLGRAIADVPGDDSLGQPRQDAVLGRAIADVPGDDSLGQPKQDAVLREAIADVPGDDSLAASSATELVVEAIESSDSCELVVAKPQGSQSASDIIMHKSEDETGPTEPKVKSEVPPLCLEPTGQDVVVSSGSEGDLHIVAAPQSLAHQILGEMDHMHKERAKAKPKTTEKPKANAQREKARPKTGKSKAKAIQDIVVADAVIAKVSAKGKAKAKGQPSATDSGVKRPVGKIELERSRMQIRARIPNGPSKSFKYTSEDDIARARSAATEFLKANS